ncbi:type 1 glutamine amidotransferase [Alkaliflexus imshenetskii]|uniref:type 1 glutamine amidotransferase n=1 Tax=Alkaliflexus imshenetskii TaxID=286730 RepID=UPI001C54EAFA|nr:type 1 glutamine amidotransferase [Alkaliflexus imshenetskii]
MNQIRIHCFMHVHFEGPGYIKTWAEQHGHQIRYTHLYANDELPAVSTFDWLIVMGGPMGVYDQQQYPWLTKELEAIKEAIHTGKTVIGICLGSQLIASALGANVYPNRAKEIGWFPVLKTESGKKHRILNGIPDQFTTFHWHGDTFDLPDEATHLLETAACSNQAFLYRERVLGLQFHLEVTPQTISEMTKEGAHELIEDQHIQTAEKITAEANRYEESNTWLTQILNYLVSK